MKIFADRLRAARKEAGHTQRSFSDLLGVQVRRYAHWEANQSEPPLELIPKICADLETHPNYLLGVSDDPKSTDPQNSRIRLIEREMRDMNQKLKKLTEAR